MRLSREASHRQNHKVNFIKSARTSSDKPFSLCAKSSLTLPLLSAFLALAALLVFCFSKASSSSFSAFSCGHERKNPGNRGGCI